MYSNSTICAYSGNPCGNVTRSKSLPGNPHFHVESVVRFIEVIKNRLPRLSRRGGSERSFSSCGQCRRGRDLKALQSHTCHFRAHREIVLVQEGGQLFIQIERHDTNLHCFFLSEPRLFFFMGRVYHRPAALYSKPVV